MSPLTNGLGAVRKDLCTRAVGQAAAARDGRAIDVDVGWALGRCSSEFGRQEVVDRGDDESDCGRLPVAVELVLGRGRLGGTRRSTGFRVEVVMSWYGVEACSRSDRRCDVKGRMGSKACGAVRKWDFWALAL